MNWVMGGAILYLLTNQIRILIPEESGIALNSPQIRIRAESLHGVG